MSLEDALVVAGLVSVVLGSVVAASNLLPQVWLMDTRVQAARRNTLEFLRETRKKGYTAPPYPPELVAQKHAEADEAFAREMADLDEQVYEAGAADAWRRQRLTLRGLLLIAIGSILQGAAALLD